LNKRNMKNIRITRIIQSKNQLYRLMGKHKKIKRLFGRQRIQLNRLN
jgi:hypothetical protein